ncbi:MAG: O-antigen ligase family protein [Patescibacteria group bacterium]
MRKLLDFIDEHGIFAAALFLLIFIPLYPKIPLFEAIPGYLVRVRLEDVLVGITGLFWLIQALRKKIEINWPMLVLVIAYAFIGLTSLLVAVFLQQTIPSQFLHISKSALHYFRYLEYFSVFFFLYSGVKSKKHVQIAVTGLVLSVALISIYGFGQKFLQWPVYSTMNREASKGVAQTLAAGARVHSTFGGHYDLAAYLVITLPILLTLILYIKNFKIKVISSLIFISGVSLLLLSASKMAFLAFLIAITLLLINKFSFKYILGLGIFGIALLSLFLVIVGGKYKESLFNKITDSQVTSSQFDETWSSNTRKYGLSMGIRLDTLWPQALYGFSINPWTGKGYATLNKLGIGEFTESDSTDNNYLRALGETGILGFIFFFAAAHYLFFNIRKSKSKDSLIKILRLGYLASFFGLLINALVIDVFAASKVAFSFWAISALVLKSSRLDNEKKLILEDKKIIKSWANKFKNNYLLIIILVIFILLAQKRPFSEYSPVQSFSNNQHAAIYVRSAICLAKDFTSCQQLLGEVSTYVLPYIIYLVPFYFIFAHPSMYYFANLFLAIFIIIAIYTLSKKFKFYKSLEKLLVVFILSILIIFNTKVSEIILNNFRDSYDTHQYRAVRRMNILAENLADPDQVPVILSHLNPDYISLFKNSDYKIIKLQDNLENNYPYFAKASQDWQNLYFSNAARHVQDEAEINNILDLSKKFALSLESIDCEHRCNIFKILEQKLKITSQPITANQKTFAKKETHKIILSTNKVARFFNPKQNSINNINRYKKLFNNFDVDAFIFVGKSIDKIEVNHGFNFRQGFIDPINKPVVYAISDHTSDSSEYGPAHQRFVLGNKLILFLDDNKEEPNQNQKIFFFDTLLQLYQNPEITDFIIISNSLDWTEQLTEEDKKVTTQYSENLKVNWHLFADKSSLEKSPEEVLDFIKKDFNYINTYFDEEPVNRVWVLELDVNGIEINSQKIIENF